MLVHAVRFVPILVERVWGSERLKDLFGKAVPKGRKIGESLELCDVAGVYSVVADGPLVGLTLRELLEKHGREFGFRQEQQVEPFGLLVKLLDANEVLSVQVHPDETAAARWPGARAKTECWYVLTAEAGSVIYHGLKEGVDRGMLERSLREGGVEELLRVHEAKAGDFFFVPAGTVHALGAGVTVAEMQTPSGTTFRLYDWDRGTRELHVEQALASVHFGEQVGYPPTAGQSRPTETGYPPTARPLLDAGNCLGQAKALLESAYFSVVHVRAERCGVRAFKAAEPMVMMVLSGGGSVRVGGSDGYMCGYGTGDTLLVPATAGGEVTVAKAGEWLLAGLGPGQVR